MAQKPPTEATQDEVLKATPPDAPLPTPKEGDILETESTITLHFVGSPYTGTLIVGVEEIAVDEGVVKVPSRLVAAARQAGFQ